MDPLWIVTFLAAAIAVAIGLRWPGQRRQLLLGAVFSLPIVGVELLAVGQFNRLGVDLAQAWLYLLLLIIGVMSVGAVVATLTDVTINRWLSPTVYQERHRLVWLGTGLIVSLVAWAAGLSLGLALIIGLVTNIILLWWLDQELLWDAVFGSMAFGAWFGLADVIFGIRSSGDIQALLFGSSPFGFTLAGLPVERILMGVMIGALIGPLYAATKFHRSPSRPRATKPSSGRIIGGVVLTILLTSTIAWTASALAWPPRVKTAIPTGQSAAGATLLDIHFTRPIDRQAIHVDSVPAMAAHMEFSQPTWSDHGFRRARIVLDAPLTSGVTYQVRVDGIQSVWGLAGHPLPFSFEASAEAPTAPPAVLPLPTTNTNTPPGPVIPPAPTPTPAPTPAPQPKPAPAPVVASGRTLSVAEDFQDQPLSCEAASLKMALAGHGVRVMEKQIMAIVGYDPTPHMGNVWGNPNVAFVGNIAGKQNTSGYGVYWQPIARAANNWRRASSFSGWTPSQLAQAIDGGDPVVIWGVTGHAYRDDWQLPNGDHVVAWHGEHARTVIGYRGSVDHPTSFVINDPVAGRITWTTATLKSNWSTFNNSGVVVY